MKQFLVLIAVLPVLLIIMVEFSLNTIINTKIDAVNDVVYTYKELAKQDGTFANVVDDMKNDLAAVVGVDSNEINVDGTYAESAPIYRAKSMDDVSSLDESFIHYKVKVPIKEMKSLGQLLKGQSDRYFYVVESYTASELLPSGS